MTNMRDKKIEKNNSKKETKEGVSNQLTIQPDYNSSFPHFYSNFASVSHTPSDLSIDFCLIAPPHNFRIDERTLYAKMVVRVTVPSDMATGLVQALQDQLKKQEQTKTKGMIIGVKKGGDKK